MLLPVNEKPENVTEADTAGIKVGETKTKSGWIENDAMGYDQVRGPVKNGREESGKEMLKEARRVVGEMAVYVGERSETHELAFEVRLRQGGTC